MFKLKNMSALLHWLKLIFNNYRKAKKAAHGISLFLVEAGMEGFNKGKILDKVGLKGKETILFYQLEKYVKIFWIFVQAFQYIRSFVQNSVLLRFWKSEYKIVFGKNLFCQSIF